MKECDFPKLNHEVYGHLWDLNNSEPIIPSGQCMMSRFRAKCKIDTDFKVTENENPGIELERTGPQPPAFLVLPHCSTGTTLRVPTPEQKAAPSPKLAPPAPPAPCLPPPVTAQLHTCQGPVTSAKRGPTQLSRLDKWSSCQEPTFLTVWPWA